MKRAILLSAVVLLLVGCGSDPNHPFFKPELSGVTYAVQSVGDPTADDVRANPQDVKAVLDVNIRCYGPMPCIDMDGTWEGWGFVDDGAYYAAPKIERPAPSAGDPTADD
jgi:hypothetical protein